MREPKLYLKDILEAAEAIEGFVEGMGYEEFVSNDLVTSAVIRKLEIIGEAAKKVPEEIKQKFSEVPWKEMAGIFGVKYDLVWQTIKRDIPEVKSAIREILNELEEVRK